ncbi:MAG: molybdenum cofactor guanylyltransferase, partial [Anaerolineae bacterium]|nr:molybdenum cofactor guanylyltransferase [Anaerolineae bacterium]
MISVAILAGGGSRRMGSDKAFLPFLGATLIERVLQRVRSLGDECFIVAPPDSRYEPLGLPVYPDVIAGMNALGGLYTAMLKAAHPLIVVVACDMPFVNERLLRTQVE